MMVTLGSKVKERECLLPIPHLSNGDDMFLKAGQWETSLILGRLIILVTRFDCFSICNQTHRHDQKAIRPNYGPPVVTSIHNSMIYISDN